MALLISRFLRGVGVGGFSCYIISERPFISIRLSFWRYRHQACLAVRRSESDFPHLRHGVGVLIELRARPIDAKSYNFKAVYSAGGTAPAPFAGKNGVSDLAGWREADQHSGRIPSLYSPFSVDFLFCCGIRPSLGIG